LVSMTTRIIFPGPSGRLRRCFLQSSPALIFSHCPASAIQSRN
jgi:hypothetical protein